MAHTCSDTAPAWSGSQGHGQPWFTSVHREVLGGASTYCELQILVPFLRLVYLLPCAFTRPWQAQAEAGRVSLLQAPWAEEPRREEGFGAQSSWNPVGSLAGLTALLPAPQTGGLHVSKEGASTELSEEGQPELPSSTQPCHFPAHLSGDEEIRGCWGGKLTAHAGAPLPPPLSPWLPQELGCCRSVVGGSNCH